MPDWKSPAELAKDATIFNNFIHALVGLYIWEVVCSLDFDWAIVTGKRKFKWPLIFYFAGRYILLGALLGIVTGLNVRSEVNCQGLYSFNSIAGDAAVGFSSINLALRVIAIYKNDKRVLGGLVLLILGQWGIIFAGSITEAVYVPGQGCVITKTNPKLISVIFFYTMVFDAIILTLSAFKLAYPFRGRSQLMKMLFADGLLYFAVALLANTIATVFMVMNLNAVMSIIFNVPAAIASTIVASRVVRRLNTWSHSGSEMLSMSSASGPIRGLAPPGAGGHLAGLAKRSATEGVHVRMETFAHAEDASDMSGKRHSLDMESAPGATQKGS